MMEKILGNYLTQANKDFPLDCETLHYLQTLISLAEIGINIAGDKTILSGCESNADGTSRSSGYVFLKTQEHPEGEILPWEGGSTASGMYIKQEDIPINANNISYPKAYTRRMLAAGIGDENYDWSDFIELTTLKEILNENKKLAEKIDQLSQTPLGIVQMWAGEVTPDNYVLCNGQELSVSAYPELYEAIGETFNKAISANGTPYTTRKDYFRVPDLRGRFVVGYHDSDEDYQTVGVGAGAKKVRLEPEQLPEHTHPLKDFSMIPDSNNKDCDNGTWTIDGKSVKVGESTITGNSYRAQTMYKYKDSIQWLEHDTESAGSGETHENRPPYYVLAYIMRAK